MTDLDMEQLHEDQPQERITLVAMDSEAINEIIFAAKHKGHTALSALPELQIAMDDQPAQREDYRLSAATSDTLKRADKPVDKPTAAAAADKPQPADKPTDKPAATAPAADKPQPADKPTDKPTATAAAADKPQPADKPTAKPTATAAAADKPQPADKPFDKPTPAAAADKPQLQDNPNPERTREMALTLDRLQKAVDAGSSENIQAVLRVARQELSRDQLRSVLQQLAPAVRFTENNGQVGDVTVGNVRYTPDGSAIFRDRHNEATVRRAADGSYHVTGPDGRERAYTLAWGCNHTPEGNTLSNGQIDNRTGRPILAFGNGPAHEGNSKGDSFLRLVQPGTSDSAGDYDGVVTDPRYQPVELGSGLVLIPRYVHPDAAVVKISDLTTGAVTRTPQGGIAVAAEGVFGSMEQTTMRRFTGGRFNTPQYGNHPVPEIRVPAQGELP